jgi:hypothetical protein
MHIASLKDHESDNSHPEVRHCLEDEVMLQPEQSSPDNYMSFKQDRKQV